MTYEEYLKGCTQTEKVIDYFLNKNLKNFAQFDSELGYIHANGMRRDGIDDSYELSTVLENGMRTPHHYTDKPCRINTYGDSFTHCDQVSDGESWQEYLAAHLCEPIRNFGVGGYGVYQAYRRMIRTERSADGAQNVIFYIWGDDHLRSLLRSRHALVYRWFDFQKLGLFHANFWCNLEMDLQSGRLAERVNLCPTPESLYRMCDPEFIYESLKDDLALQMQVYLQYDDVSDALDLKSVRKLADILNVPFNGIGGPDFKNTIRHLCDKYSFAATEYTLDRCREFLQIENKKLLVVLFDPYRAMRELIRTGTRYDREVVDYLNEKDYRYFDMNVVHAEDYKCFNISLEEYYKRYFIGHYNPAGNHFFAFSIKNHIIDMLEPKPITYNPDDEEVIGYEGYLNIK